MFRRPAVIAVAACLAAVAVPSPALAADSFTAPVTVVDPPCGTGGTSDAAFGGSTIRGFASFPDCSHGIYYFQGGTQGYTRVPAPYTGIVLGVDADETATYLIYRMTDPVGRTTGIGVTRRTHAGVYGSTQVVSGTAATQAVLPTADIAAEGGRWWAVWTEQVGPGGEFATQQLFQARTYGTVVDRQQITATTADNSEPSISLDSRGAVLAWTRWTAPEQPGPADLWVATNPGTAWTSRVFSAAGSVNRTADLKRIGGVTFVSWVRDGRIVEAENTPGTFVSHVFLTPGDRPRVGSTYGSQFVTWTTPNGVYYARGNNGAQTFAGQLVAAPGTVLDTMVAVNGKGTLLVRSGLRLYSISSLTTI